MKILINGISIMPDSGGATYTMRLFDRLFDKNDPDFILLCSTTNEELFLDYEGANVQVAVLPIPTNNNLLRVPLEQLLIPLLAIYWRADLLFAPRNIVPFLTPIRSVVVMHSMHLNYKHRIDDFSLLQRAYAFVVLPLSLYRATRVIAISETIKRTLINEFSINKSNIDVVYHGSGISNPREIAIKNGVKSNNSAKEKDHDAIIQAVDSPYILFLSQLAWHKNAHLLIDAFEEFKNSYEKSHTLVIAGKDVNGNRSRLEKMCGEYQIEDDVKFLGRVPETAINPLYQGADVFVYPSSIEGFGLPPLEAMANGTPVIGSNRTSVPEIIGDAGVIVDPDDTTRLAEAIYNVVTDNTLRAELVKRGYKRVENFSWDRTADETYRILKNVCNCDY